VRWVAVGAFGWMTVVGVPWVMAEGHGPVFGLATPTLGQGGWSSDTVVMVLRTAEGAMGMVREMVGYGITEDLQVAVAFPVVPRVGRLSMLPRTRVGSMMTGVPDVEAFGLWRFYRRGVDVGARLEATLLVGGAIPVEGRRSLWGREVRLGPAMHGALTLGYTSRTLYAWVGGGFERYASRGGDRPGDLVYGTLVLGWRPPTFRHDYPKPDWRLFVEVMAEASGRVVVGGKEVSSTGGRKVLVGPSLLGLYGSWGVSAGVLVPVYQDLNGPHAPERWRAKWVFTLWP